MILDVTVPIDIVAIKLTRRDILFRRPLYARGVSPLVAFVRVRLLASGDTWTRASFVIMRTLSCHGFWARTAFRREWRLSSDALSTRAAFVSWWPFAARVFYPHVAIVPQRPFDALGVSPLASFLELCGKLGDGMRKAA